MAHTFLSLHNACDIVKIIYDLINDDNTIRFQYGRYRCHILVFFPFLICQKKRNEYNSKWNETECVMHVNSLFRSGLVWECMIYVMCVDN